MNVRIKLLFKVLIVLYRSPFTSPSESPAFEQPVAKVAFLYLISELAVAQGIFPALFWIYNHSAVVLLLDIRIVKRVDVDSFP